MFGDVNTPMVTAEEVTRATCKPPGPGSTPNIKKKPAADSDASSNSSDIFQLSIPIFSH